MTDSVLEDVVRIIKDVLRLGPGAEGMTADSPLLGAIPEMDSMAVVSLMTALEEHFGVGFEDDEITGESFEAVGSLVALVESKLNG